MDINSVVTWEYLQKIITWKQIGNVENKRVLDFGSGNGVTADHFADNNEVTAIEPNAETIKERSNHNVYTQINGSVEQLKQFEDGTFDMIICHCVLEYVKDRADVLKEFERLLKKDGTISILKHNRSGRVMQMVVLLNDFKHANELLDGKNGKSKGYGDIMYYEDNEITEWSENLEVQKVYGMRAFWSFQQNQEIQTEDAWREDMIKMEMRVSEMEEFKAIASFHHVILKKK